MKGADPTPLHSTAERWGERATLPLAPISTASSPASVPMIDEQERMRRHVRFFVNGDQVFDLSEPLRPTDEVVIVQALSGG
jgi:hypothetical protein